MAGFTTGTGDALIVLQEYFAHQPVQSPVGKNGSRVKLFVQKLPTDYDFVRAFNLLVTRSSRLPLVHSKRAALNVVPILKSVICPSNSRSGLLHLIHTLPRKKIFSFKSFPDPLFY